MARSCGLRIGARRFELVVLEGSAKKFRIVSSTVGDLGSGVAGEAGDPPADAVASLQAEVKKHAIPTDNIGLAVDTGLAAFRNLKMPFADRAKIEQVLKFEVESLLPQWNIDDVVVDFHTLAATSDSSDLLVTAVPKAELRKLLDLCAKAGAEPQEAELEITAMVNAALAAGLCGVDNAQILVHVGESSTSVVVMDAGKVREMRAIHLGALSHEIAPMTITEEETPLVEGDATEATAPDPSTDPAEVERRLDQVVRRIRRELGRTVSAARTVHPIEAIYVCGLGIPDLATGQVLDVPVQPLDVFSPMGESPDADAGELVVAYGCALRQLGGGELHPSLRREELHYTGALERLELPLAVVALLLVTFLGVWNIFLYKESTFLDAKLGVWRDWTRTYLVGNINKGQAGILKSPSDDVRRYLTNLDEDVDRTKFEQLEHVKALLQGEVKKLEKDLGQDAEISQPQSALTALTLVLDVLEKRTSGGLARPSLRKATAVYQRGKANRPDSVKVSFDLTFFADSPALATNFYEAFKRDLESQPWYVDFEDRPNSALDDGKGIFLSGVSVTVDVSKAPIG
jgi:Tfp pilus assembly PilM family ATPase